MKKNELILEVWKDIYGYKGLYQVNRCGQVKSLARKVKFRNGLSSRKEKILSAGPTTSGYSAVTLSRNGKIKGFQVHRLVALAFIPNPDRKPDINHINGIKMDNRVKNIEWCTASENILHSHRIGLRNHKGESHSQSKLTEEDVRDIRVLEGLHKNIALIYGVTAGNVSMVKRRQSWLHLK